jgi:hypothetical protein
MLMITVIQDDKYAELHLLSSVLTDLELLGFDVNNHDNMNIEGKLFEFSNVVAKCDSLTLPQWSELAIARKGKKKYRTHTEGFLKHVNDNLASKKFFYVNVEFDKFIDNIEDKRNVVERYNLSKTMYNLLMNIGSCCGGGKPTLPKPKNINFLLYIIFKMNRTTSKSYYLTCLNILQKELPEIKNECKKIYTKIQNRK